MKIFVTKIFIVDFAISVIIIIFAPEILRWQYMVNPFKFGSVVEDEFFTDRVNEVKYIRQFIDSRNHLILISPRRFGKSSVVLKAVKPSGRPFIMLNLQNITSVTSLASKLLKEIYNINP